MRLINRVLAALLSLALIVLGVLVIAEVIAARVGRKPAIVHWRQAYAWAGRTSWNQGSVRVTCIVLAVLGLVLLLAELKRAPVTRLATEPADSDAEVIDTAYTSRGAAAAVRAAVTGVDGVRSASVGVSRRKVTVTAKSSARDKAAAQRLAEPVSAAAEQRLSALQLRKTPSVSARVTPRSR